MRRSTIFIGFDPRPAEAQGFAVTRGSFERRLSRNIPIRGLVLSELRAAGLYRRPVQMREGRMWDPISEAPMSTEFAISRFLAPIIAQSGWALVTDCDMLARDDIAKLFDQADDRYAVMVVKHDHRPAKGTKMDGQIQTTYERKNWSSVVLYNCDHSANKALTVDLVNEARGLWLHQFRWLPDHLIGSLDPRWNHLVDYSPPNKNAGIVHFTEGTPGMAGFEHVEYADEWRAELARWAT